MLVQLDGPIATITLDRPDELNPLYPQDYSAFAKALDEIDRHPNIAITVWQANGKWFSAGSPLDATESRVPVHARPERSTAGIVEVLHALSSHSKILVAAVNGPAVGVAVALLSQFDFIYGTTSACISVPFYALDLFSQAVSSATFVGRIGLKQANRALLTGKTINAQEMWQCRFLNKIFSPPPSSSTSTVLTSERFHELVSAFLLDHMSYLDPSSHVASRELVRAKLQGSDDSAQIDRFMSIIPALQSATESKERARM